MNQPLDPAVQAIVDAAVQQALRNYQANAPQPQRGERGEPGPQGEQGPPGQDGSGNGGDKWNLREIGYLDPFYEGKSIESGVEPIEHHNNDTIYRDVHLFIERAKEVAVIKGAKVVRDNLWRNLKGDAIRWWDGEMSPGEKRLSRMSEEGREVTGIDEWIALLHARFKKPSNLAMEALTKERYTIRDAANRREPREYAQKMLRLAKDAGMSLVQNQLDLMFNGIDLDVRASDIRRP